MSEASAAAGRPGRVAHRNKQPSRQPQPQSFYVGRLAELLVWDLRSSGKDVPGGQYYGRDYASVITHGEAIVEHYCGITLAGRSIVHEAGAQAVNARLRELKLTGTISAEDLVDDSASENTESLSGYDEPEVLYLNRLKTFADARHKVDKDPIGSFTAIDRFLASNPLSRDVRDATRVVSHLEQHTGLDFQRRVLLGGAFDMALAAAGPGNA